MFPKKWLKVTAFIVGSLFAFVLIGSVLIAYLINVRLPSIIEERNDTPYHFTYTDLNFSLFNSSLALSGVEISPKDSLLIKDSIDLTAKIKRIDVVGINFYRLINEKELAALSIRLIEPDIHYYLSDKKTPKTGKESQLGQQIDVNSLVLKNGKFKLFSDAGQQELARIHNFSVDIDGIKFNERTREKRIPFTLQDFKISVDSLYYQINPYHYIKTSDLKINAKDFIMKDFIMKPLVSRKKFKNRRTSVNTLLDIEAPHLTLNNTNWGFKNDILFVNTQSIHVDSLNAKILSQKKEEQTTQEVAKEIKNFFINFDLKVDTLRIKKSRFLATSKFDFKNIDLTLVDFNNQYQKKMVVRDLRLKNAHFTIFGQPERVAQRKNSSPDFNDIIAIASTSVKNAKLELIPYGKKKPDVQLGTIDLNFKQILLDPTTIQKAVPFTYQSVLLTSKSLAYDMDNVYKLTTGPLRFENGRLEVEQLKLTPKLSRAQFVAQLAKERDLYVLSVPQLTARGVAWGLRENKSLYVHVSQLDLHQLNANVYRSKKPADDLSRKPMFSEKLRKMKFDLAIQKVGLIHAHLVYEEEADKANSQAGKLIFSRINTVITNVNSGFQKKTLPDLVVDWKSDFMGAPMAVLWKFNPMSQHDHFTVQGNITNLPAQEINSFIQPNINASVQGSIQEVKFKFAGNQFSASGDYAMKHENLRATVYRKDGERKRKVVTAIGNLLMKKNTRDQFREAQIKDVQRKQDKSFFNFLWLCILEGLKKTLLII